jgi:ribosome maturation factor RimP
MVRIKTYQPIDGQKVFRGRLLGLVEGTIKVELEAEKIIEIPLAGITKASLEVEF